MKKVAVLALVVALAGCGQAPMTTGYASGPLGSPSASSKALAFDSLTRVSVELLGRTGNNYVDVYELTAEGPGLDVTVVFEYVPLLDEPGDEPSAAFERISKLEVNGKALTSSQTEALGEALMKHASKAGAKKDLVAKLGWFLAM